MRSGWRCSFRAGGRSRRGSRFVVADRASVRPPHRLCSAQTLPTQLRDGEPVGTSGHRRPSPDTWIRSTSSLTVAPYPKVRCVAAKYASCPIRAPDRNHATQHCLAIGHLHACLRPVLVVYKNHKASLVIQTLIVRTDTDARGETTRCRVSEEVSTVAGSPGRPRRSCTASASRPCR
jgi:hypothetical protein